MASIRDRHPEVFRIADELVHFTDGFPWGASLVHSADPIENLWRYYNIVFVVASHRLLRMSVAVMEAGLMFETLIPLRTHLELLGTQRYVEADKGRLVTFAVRGAKRQQQLVERARRLGHGSRDDWSAMAGRASRDLNRLKDHDANIPLPHKAEEILKDVGFQDDIDGVLRVADNFVHMNGSALDFYAHATPTGQIVVEMGPDTEGANLLLSAVRYHHGILQVANEALSLKQEGTLAALWDDFQTSFGSPPAVS